MHQGGSLPANPLTWNSRFKAVVLAGAVVLLLSLGLVLLKWPFTKDQTIKTLEARSGRKVTIGSFESTYLPPGMVVRDIHFLRIEHPEKEPLIVVKRLEVRASWTELLTFQHRIPRVDVYDMHLAVPPRGLGQDGKRHTLIPLNDTNSKNGQGLRFDKVVFHTALVEFLPGLGGTEPLQISIRELILTRLRNNEPFGLEAVLENPVPHGEVHEKGTFGPWDSEEPSRTPLNGTFTFHDANLRDIPGLSGTLQAEGKFAGTLDNIEVEGSARVPDFRVLQSSHVEPLVSNYSAAVNATDGDVQLRKVDTTLGHTTVHAEGRVAGAPNVKGKTAVLQAQVRGGRVEDLEKMLMKSKIPPLIGGISLETSIRLPPGPAPFLTRLEMAGTFATMGERFTNPKTQGTLNELAKQPVDSRMSAKVVVKGGVARIDGLRLTCPETEARLDGTFNLISKQVALKGTLKTDGKLADTQSGFKAFAVKLITPFLKKRGATVVPFEIHGDFGDLQTRMDLDGKRTL